MGKHGLFRVPSLPVEILLPLFSLYLHPFATMNDSHYKPDFKIIALVYVAAVKPDWCFVCKDPK